MASLTHQTVAQMLVVPFESVFQGPRLKIGLVDPVCQAYVSGAPDDATFRSAIAVALGFALPAEPNHVAGNQTRALSIAPGRWLVVSEDPVAGTLTSRMTAGLYSGGGLVSDMRDGLAVFDLSGPDVRQILAMGCALDLDHESMAPGRCARTLFAGVNVTLYPVGSREHYRIHVDRALARHLMEWLAKAATGVA